MNRLFTLLGITMAVASMLIAGRVYGAGPGESGKLIKNIVVKDIGYPAFGDDEDDEDEDNLSGQPGARFAAIPAGSVVFGDDEDDDDEEDLVRTIQPARLG